MTRALHSSAISLALARRWSLQTIIIMGFTLSCLHLTIRSLPLTKRWIPTDRVASVVAMSIYCPTIIWQIQDLMKTTSSNNSKWWLKPISMSKINNISLSSRLPKDQRSNKGTTVLGPQHLSINHCSRKMSSFLISTKEIGRSRRISSQHWTVSRGTVQRLWSHWVKDWPKSDK